MTDLSLDKALDELLELIQGKKVLDFLAVPVHVSDSTEARHEKAEAAAALQGFRLDQCRLWSSSIRTPSRISRKISAISRSTAKPQK